MNTAKQIALGFITSYAMTAVCLPGVALWVNAAGYHETARALLTVAAQLVFVQL